MKLENPSVTGVEAGGAPADYQDQAFERYSRGGSVTCSRFGYDRRRLRSGIVRDRGPHGRGKNYQHRDASHGSFSGFTAVRLHRRADNQCRRRKHHELIGVISNLDIFNETEARLRSISFVFVYDRVAFDEQWPRKTI